MLMCSVLFLLFIGWSVCPYPLSSFGALLTRFTDNSPTNQLSEIDIYTFRHMPKCSGKYESCTHL